MKKKPLKIVLFDGSFKTTTFINRLAEGLAKNHQVYIFGFNEELENKIEGIRYIALGSNQNKFRFLQTTLIRHLQSGKIRELIKNLTSGDRKALQIQNLETAVHRIRPDVIHLQWTSVIPYMETILEEGKIPVILSQRGFHTNVKPFVEPENLIYLQKWYPRMAAFHSVSKAIQKNGDRIKNFPGKIDDVIYTGLDSEKLPFQKTYRHQKPVQLLSAGRSHWIKGYETSILACSFLKKKGLDFRYTIIGAAGDEALQYMIADLDLKEEISLLPQQTQEFVFSKMQNASLLLLPSLEEGLPNVLVEAMALGLPVISSDCGGVPELVEPDQNGFLVPVLQPETMADAILNFTQMTEEEIENLKVRARKKIETRHNLIKMTEEMENLYRKAIHNFN